MSIDYGKKNTGVALSDETQTVAFRETVIV